MRRWLGVVTLLLTGCTSFSDPTLGVCGNRVVEDNEDCDDPEDDECGAANEPTACRLLCDVEDDDRECAPGRRCGNDGVCRAPSGDFSGDSIQIEEEGTRWIEVGDFDGDARDDLLFQFAEPDVKIVYFDGAEISELTVREPYAGVVAVGDLTSEGLDDVLMVPESIAEPDEMESSRLSLWRGTEERTALATNLATLRTDGSEARLLSATPERDRIFELVDPSTTRHWSSQEPTAEDVTPVGAGGNSLGLAVAVADLDGGSCTGDPDFSMHEVAFATEGDGSVVIGSTCGAGTGFDLLPGVDLPAGRSLGRAGTFFVHVDADNLDLLAQDDAGAVHVAYGVGDGTFHSDPMVPNSDGDGRFADVPLFEPIGEPGKLLAVADFDDDGSPELVTEDYYLPEPESCGGGMCIRERWELVEFETLEFAVAIDFNDDGVLDIAALTEDVLSIHLGGSLGPLAFAVHEFELIGPARELVVGDFNRDTIADLAFTELCEDPPTDAGEEITVAYGGSLDPPQFDHFGPFVLVQTLAVEQGATIVARVIDKAGRAAGAFIRPDDSEHDFGVILRQPVLTRELRETEEGVVVGLTAASVVVDPKDGSHSLASFGFVDGSLSAHDVTKGDFVDIPPVDSVRTLATAVDLNGDSVDELIVLGPGGAANVWVGRRDGEGHLRVDATFNAGPGFARRAVEEERPSSSLAVGDVDGDGDVDVLATTDEQVPRVVVLRNDDGVLTADGAVFLNVVSAQDFRIDYLTAWHVDAEGVGQWLVAGETVAGVARVDLDAGELQVTTAFEHPEEEVSFVALAAADVDGDGLLDLVVAGSEVIFVHRAEEAIGNP